MYTRQNSAGTSDYQADDPSSESPSLEAENPQEEHDLAIMLRAFDLDEFSDDDLMEMTFLEYLSRSQPLKLERLLSKKVLAHSSNQHQIIDRLQQGALDITRASIEYLTSFLTDLQTIDFSLPATRLCVSAALTRDETEKLSTVERDSNKSKRDAAIGYLQWQILQKERHLVCVCIT